MHTKIVFQRLDRFWDYIYNNNAHKNIRRRDTMKLKHVRTLAAGVITAALLVLTGVAGGADTVQAAGPGMAVTAVISGTEVSVKASGTSVPASDDGMLYLFAEPVYSDAITTSGGKRGIYDTVKCEQRGFQTVFQIYCGGSAGRTVCAVEYRRLHCEPGSDRQQDVWKDAGR